MATAKIETQCNACAGTGVYRWFAEPPGVGVVCLTCNGTGCRVIEYVPFDGRQRRDGIDTVQESRGATILSCGPSDKASVSYEQFFAGKMPT